MAETAPPGTNAFWTRQESMTLDDYVAWAAGIGAAAYSRAPESAALLELGLGFASEIGEVAGVLTKWLRDGGPRWDHLADELGDVAYYWARLSQASRTPASMLLAHCQAHVEWRRAGRPAGGPAPVAGGISLDEFTTWVVATDGAGSMDPSHGGSVWAIGLAMAGDAGEVVECVRSLLRDGNGPRERLAGELGDVWRYWTRLCLASGIRPGELLARSRAKIEERLSTRTQGL
jgi:NTP pyrophosphatase (non-canonical NTP hydrolase)